MSSALPFASRGADELTGPGVSGSIYVGTTSALTTSASSIDTFANNTNPGGRWVSFQARGGDAYVRFGATATTGTTGTAASNGFKIADGARFDKWVDTDERYCDAIGSASMSLFWWQSSPNYMNRP